MLGYVQAPGEPGVAQAVAAEAGTILMGYGEDGAERMLAITAQMPRASHNRPIGVQSVYGPGIDMASLSNSSAGTELPVVVFHRSARVEGL